MPIALAFSPLGKAFYVADGKDGTISVVDPTRLEVRARIDARLRAALDDVDTFTRDAAPDAIGIVEGAIGRRPFRARHHEPRHNQCQSDIVALHHKPSTSAGTIAPARGRGLDVSQLRDR